MITVYGEGRGFRVVWMLEELGLPYILRPVDMLAGVENDNEFMALNPSGFIPVLVDGETVLCESIAILQYLLARNGPSDLAPGPQDADFARYLQFLHMGEAGLAMPIFMAVVTTILAPPEEQGNWTVRKGQGQYENRMRLVRRQLAQTPFIAGARFTAADISVTYALTFAQRTGNAEPQAPEREYVARMIARPGYQRAMASCHATRGWAETVPYPLP